MSEYWQGQAIELRVAFRDRAGAPAAVTGVGFRIRKPDGALSTVEAAEDPAGGWVATVIADQVGQWIVKARSSAPAAGVDQVTFSVRASLPEE